MSFIRFVLTSRDPGSEVAAGVFTLAYKLKDSPGLEAADRELLAESLEWFGKNLDTPTRFNRSVKGLRSATDARNCLVQGLGD